MKKQVVVIHGGDAFDTYEKYIENLRAEEIDFDDLFQKGWKKTLADRLGDGFQVIAPQMPNKANAKYLEWKIWFDKITPFVTDGVILVGHSLGGMFLARYLAENTFARKIRAVMIVASPHTKQLGESLADFVIPRDLSRFEKQSGDIFLYYSSDDPLVINAFEHMKSYQKSLPKAHIRTFTDRGHFSQEEFPEIVEDIKKLK
ncbi:MAG: alpha/beta hydrolase [bacterium]|nr:alpha/beta hydrolase [bacterium]